MPGSSTCHPEIGMAAPAMARDVLWHIPHVGELAVAFDRATSGRSRYVSGWNQSHQPTPASAGSIMCRTWPCPSRLRWPVTKLREDPHLASRAECGVRRCQTSSTEFSTCIGFTNRLFSILSATYGAHPFVPSGTHKATEAEIDALEQALHSTVPHLLEQGISEAGVRSMLKTTEMFRHEWERVEPLLARILEQGEPE